MRKDKEHIFSPMITIFMLIILMVAYSIWFMSPAVGQQGKASKDVQSVPAPSQKAVKVEPPVPATNPVQLNNLLTAAQVNPTAKIVSLATEKGPAKFHTFSPPPKRTGEPYGKYLVYDGPEGDVYAIVENGKVTGSESTGLGITDHGQVRTGNYSSPDCWHCYELEGQNHCLKEQCVAESPQSNNPVQRLQ
jgi:hypothetical protein